MKILKKVSILFLFALCICGMSNKNEIYKDDMFKRFNSFVEKAMKIYGVPGCAVSIISDNKIVHTKGFGYRDLENKLQVTPETAFAIGSCTKAFTATALGILVNQGKLDWDAPIKKYIPNFSMHEEAATNKLSVRDCLLHRTGLPRYDCLWDKNLIESREDIVKKLKFLKPTENFRDKFQYNNLMYALAGYVLENISETRWDRFVKEHITDKLQMNNTFFSSSDVPHKENAALAYEYDKESKKFNRVEYIDIDAIGPAGSMYSSVIDLSKWIMMNISPSEQKVIKEETLNEIHSPQIPLGERYKHLQYGLGWIHNSKEKITVHSGSIRGCCALLIFSEDKKIGCAILTNIDDVDEFNDLLSEYIYAYVKKDSKKIEKLEEELLKATEDPNEATPSQEFQKITEEEANRFAGTYHNEIFGEITIEASSSSLKANWYNEVMGLGYVNRNKLQETGCDDANAYHLIFESDFFDIDIEENCYYRFTRKQN